MTPEHPDQFLARLKTQIGRRAHPKLLAIHEACGEIARGPIPRDFSLVHVGKRAGKNGGPALNTLYSPAGKHFGVLIRAWAAFASEAKRPASTQANRPLGTTQAILDAIEDPVLRTLVGERLAELRRLRGEVNTLKATANLIIDRRPKGADSVTPNQRPAQLTDTEWDALRTSISSDWLRRQGWKIGSDGEILTGNANKTVLPIGFYGAVQKLIATSPALK